MYASDPSFYLGVLDQYARPDNPLWIPETGRGDAFAPYFFAALGKGALGFSPFGVDWTGGLPVGSVPRAHAANFALVGSMDRTLAKLNFEGRIKTAIEVAGGADQQMLFTPKPNDDAPGAARAKRRGRVRVMCSLILLRSQTRRCRLPKQARRRRGRRTPREIGLRRCVSVFRNGMGSRRQGPRMGEGRVLVAQLGPDEYLLTGIGRRCVFSPSGLSARHSHADSNGGRRFLYPVGNSGRSGRVAHPSDPERG